jgi:rare lipoprotein A
MRRTIGISLVCLVTSACAIAETPEESTTQSTSVAPLSPGMPPDQSRSLACEVGERRSADYGFERVQELRASFTSMVDMCGGVPCCGLVRAAGSGQFGKAAWYDFVGKKTASGEILDKVTATAAHRSLPLASYARVTNLDNSRSVIVKINDRGPYTRGRIIDLSPRAADALDMKRAGVAPVVIEPLVYQTSPTVAAVQTSGATLARQVAGATGGDAGVSQFVRRMVGTSESGTELL